MKINLKGTGMVLTPAIKNYVVKRVTNLGKLLSRMEEDGGEAFVHFEVGKSTKHHKSGNIFHSDCLVKIQGDRFYASADGEDLHQTIDEVKESLFLEIKKKKTRRQTLARRGAKSVKKMMKGLSKRNPQTGKY